jgi:hypothetical protein
MPRSVSERAQVQQHVLLHATTLQLQLMATPFHSLRGTSKGLSGHDVQMPRTRGGIRHRHDAFPVWSSQSQIQLHVNHSAEHTLFSGSLTFTAGNHRSRNPDLQELLLPDVVLSTNCRQVSARKVGIF